MGRYTFGIRDLVFGLLLPALLLGGCSVLPEPEPVSTDLYVLEYAPGQKNSQNAVADAPVLIITTPSAHSGYDSYRIAYMQQAYGLRYYTRSRWADKPARMLAPLVADAMQATGQFQALYAAPGSLAADYRLDTELIRLHQDFTRQPSVVRITLRAKLIELQSHRVIATRQFDIYETAVTDDTYGGVVAANKAVNRLFDELAQFCVQAR
jgi:cholesterol transport system auxiliary component